MRRMTACILLHMVKSRVLYSIRTSLARDLITDWPEKVDYAVTTHFS